MALSRDQILSVTDQKIEIIPVPEWGGEVCLRGMTGAERDIWEIEMYGGDKPNLVNARARLLVRCLCDEKGERLFSDAEIEILSRRSAQVLDRLFIRAKKLSGVSNEDLEVMIKNSDPQGGAASSIA